MKIISAILFQFFFFTTASAQLFTRFEAEFSIKEIGYDGMQNLMTGTLYYNQVMKQVYYQFDFPEKSAMAINDSCTLRITEKIVIPHPLNLGMIDFSIYNLFLNQNLESFGLNETPYILTHVAQEKDMVISTWKLPGKQIKEVGTILLSQKNGRLFGMVTLDTNEEVVSRQFFLDYQEVENLPFPTKVIQFYYQEGKELKKITTYRNIKLNSDEDRDKYNYRIDFVPVSTKTSLMSIEK
ncbi:MAG: hypothetical protein EOL88_11330 [Bacteroidia bacterium]|nr:hypothetical protein [Bacteroidales bacterium]MDD3011548.1 hypothetical protein [Bacteroidales bacterium]NCD42672.1 hypothetical protein [Bacteroidia bacterium]